MPERRIEHGVASMAARGAIANVSDLCVVRPARAEPHTPGGLIAVVCDGQDGDDADERAAALARRAIITRLERDALRHPRDVERALHAANAVVHLAAQAGRGRHGVSVSCGVLHMRDGLAHCAHVGDVRCYLVRGNDLFCMTVDHTLAMGRVRDGHLTLSEARRHPDRRVLTHALGVAPTTRVSSWAHPCAVQPGDTFVLCSRGLHDHVSDDTIRQAVQGHETMQESADSLVTRALASGASGTVSIVMLHMPARV